MVIFSQTKELKANPRKVAAIQKMEAPTSTDGVKCFLGHVTYMSKFIPNLSAEAELLRRLLQHKTFVWAEGQQKAFLRIKGIFLEAENLQCF